MKPIRPGDLAPAFTTEAHTCRQITLADYRGKQVVVLFFYPKDGTPVCTAEACAFRDAYEEFAKAGAVVIGVSSDSLDRHRAFAQQHNLLSYLVSDQNGALRKLFGVPKTLGLLPGRVTYVIDREGVVRHVFSSQFAAGRHVAEALEVVRKLAQQDGEQAGQP